MRGRTFGVVVGLGIGSSGCHNFESVDDACKDSVGGDQYGEDESDAFFERLDCYRRYAGVDRPRIDKYVSEAAEAHTSYLSQNGVAPYTDWTLEAAGLSGFTGEDAYVRLDQAGFILEGADTLVWQLLMPADPSRPRAEMVDLLINDPNWRDPLFAPGWLGGGYAEGTDLIDGLAYAMWCLALPSGQHSSKPVFWPVEDAEDVPISYLGAGYPITMTFGSSLIGTNFDNPLDVILRSSSITAEDGTVVEHLVELPGFDPYFGSNNSTVTLFPTVVLQPDTLYTVEAEVDWISYPEGKTFEWSFLTGTEAVTATLFQ